MEKFDCASQIKSDIMGQLQKRKCEGDNSEHAAEVVWWCLKNNTEEHEERLQGQWILMVLGEMPFGIWKRCLLIHKANILYSSSLLRTLAGLNGRLTA